MDNEDINYEPASTWSSYLKSDKDKRESIILSYLIDELPEVTPDKRLHLSKVIAKNAEKFALEQRLVELDLLEQALNAGWTMDKFKEYRLQNLLSRLDEYNASA